MRTLTSPSSKQQTYLCQKDWPVEVFTQYGDSGTVFTQNSSYRTAFFEIFADSFGFLRGEGKTVVDAEEDAWGQFQEFLKCKGHEYERRDYRNGLGFCKHCGHSKSNAFEPLERCATCDVPTYHTSHDGKWFCEEHAPPICLVCRTDKEEKPDIARFKTHEGLRVWICAECSEFFVGATRIDKETTTSGPTCEGHGLLR